MKLLSTTLLRLFTLLITTAVNSFGQAPNQMMHEEKMEDPYLPNAFHNKKVSPGYRYQSPTNLKGMGSSITTVQVNVDPSGQNILGDAGNETNIAVNPLNPNEIVIGWRQFDNVTSNFRQAGWSYTSDGGETWTFPGVIQPGLFRSDPVLDYDATGNFYYNSLTGDFECDVFQSADGGASWNNGTFAFGGDKQWMAIDRTGGIGNGNIYAFWSSAYSTCQPGFFTRSSDGGSSFESCTVVDGYPFWGTMAVGNDGELYIGGAGDELFSLLVAKSDDAQIPASLISWNSPVSVFIDGFISGSTVNPGGLMGQVSIDVDRSDGDGHGNVYVLASRTRAFNGDPGDVMFAASTDGGVSWNAPIKINDDSSDLNTQWFGTMSVAPNGRIDAIWLDTRDAITGSDTSALYYSYSMDQGINWSVNEKLSPLFDPHVGYPNQQKMGDYFDMISDNNGAHLAWANTLNGEQDVYYTHIVPADITGTSAASAENHFQVFPNPSSGSLIISGPGNDWGVEISNALGEKVFSGTAYDKDPIDISFLAGGIYFLKIEGEGGAVSIKKFIRE
jgi:hypothetical protein